MAFLQFIFNLETFFFKRSKLYREVLNTDTGIGFDNLVIKQDL